MAVIVVGSGAAGLAAALAASRAGAEVILLERDGLLGGTTAMSGGVVWAPANRLQREAGVGDSAEAALTYLETLATGDVDATLMATFVSDAARVVDEIEEATPIEWELLRHWPDYHSEIPGGLSGGRSIWPRPLAVPAAIAARIRRPPEIPVPEITDAGDASSDATVFRGPVRGHTLVAGLVIALLELGVEIRTSTRPTRLRVIDGVVTGVDAADGGWDGAVILATGGFQHDPALTRTFLPVPSIAPLGPPACAGDGLRMALSAGAMLGNMAEGWWMPSLGVPGETVDGMPYYRPFHSERAQPGSVMVDRSGRRFVDEAQNYGDVGRAMHRFDAATHTYPAAPAWLVFDARYRQRYPVGPLNPTDPDPAWLKRADSLEKLATAVGTDLVATVAEFNGDAEHGRDARFGRGHYPYDRWIGDHNADHPTLATIAVAPFYAVPVEVGCMGTKGGPRTDDRGQVLDLDGRPVVGLYAAGNVAASPFGTATAAGGATLGPALVFGTRAGEAAAEVAA